MIPPEQVDQAILASCTPQFRKVSQALKLPEGTKLDFISDRIKALVKAERLESQGNLDRPRFSEIRLPQI
jgi:hypothetical protein